MSNDTYDVAEATFIFGNVIAELAPRRSYDARMAAARSLLGTLATTLQALGYSVDVHADAIVVVVPGAAAAVVVIDDTTANFVVRSDAYHGDPPVVVPLIFDPSRSMWTTAEPDAFRAPRPGEPMARRSAAATIADAVATRLRADAARRRTPA